jgi:hypothetical protein
VKVCCNASYGILFNKFSQEHGEGRAAKREPRSFSPRIQRSSFRGEERKQTESKLESSKGSKGSTQFVLMFTNIRASAKYGADESSRCCAKLLRIQRNVTSREYRERYCVPLSSYLRIPRVSRKVGNFVGVPLQRRMRAPHQPRSAP